MRPTGRFLVGFSLGLPLAALPAIVDARLWSVWCAFVVAAALLLAVDAVLAPPARAVEVDATVPEAVPVGDGGEVEIRLAARTDRGVEVLVRLVVGPPFSPPADRRVRLADGGGEARFALLPARRGPGRVEEVWLAWTGPFGLLRRVVRRRLGLEVVVTPDLGRSRREALTFLDVREHRAGLKAVRYLGDGSEFEALREYLPGFDRRQIDWKASARHRKLLCREHRAERNHQVVVAVDTGHLMIEPLDGAPKVDRAIHAALSLALVAARTGDRVGFYTFDERPGRFVAPAAGTAHVVEIQRCAAEVEYSTSETNFSLGLLTLSARLRRRAMIVVTTEFVDTVTAELMVESIAHLARRHLVLFVTFRDPALEELRSARPRSVVDMHRAVLAEDLRRERRVVRRRLARLGVQVLEAPWSAVGAELLNRYLEIKRRELV
ncbi:MAG: DUF58 domain-containing protein [Planctomycetota bacterium JB042]